MRKLGGEIRAIAFARNCIEEAQGVLRAADGLGARLSEPTLNAVAELLRRINTYYSNLIEGHVTYPADVERAMAGDYAADPAKRDLQVEALAHIEVQKLVEERIAADPHLNVCDPGFLLMLHRAFYDRLPESMHIVRSPDGYLEEPVVGGTLRSFDVTVGDYHPPTLTVARERAVCSEWVPRPYHVTKGAGVPQRVLRREQPACCVRSSQRDAYSFETFHAWGESPSAPRIASLICSSPMVWRREFESARRLGRCC